MNLYERAAAWSSWWWPLFANHIWQSTVVALLLLALSMVLRRGPAWTRYAILSLAAAKFLLPSSFLAYLAHQAGADWASLFSSPGDPPAGAAVFFDFASPLFEGGGARASLHTGAAAHGGLLVALTLLWSLGAVALLALWCRRRVRFRVAMRSFDIIEGRREEAAIARVRSWLGIRRQVGLAVLPRPIEPAVLYVWKPVVALPEGMADELSEAELEAVIMHEMVHVGRWDNLVADMQTVVRCLFWFHPVVWVLDRMLFSERERCCDEEVVRLSGTPEVYGSSLLKVLKFCLGHRIAGASHVTGSNLKRRIEQIMDKRTHGSLKMSHRLLIAAVSVIVMLISVAFGLASRNTANAQDGSSSISPGALESMPQSRSLAPPPAGTDGLSYFASADGAISVPSQRLEDLQKQIEAAPEIQIQSKEMADSPVTINYVSVRAILLNRVDSPRSADTYLIKPRMTLTNNSGRRITGITLSFSSSPRRKMTVHLARLTIEPYGTYNLGGAATDSGVAQGHPDSPLHVFAMPGDPLAIVATVAAVRFEDGSRWGTPLPPAPPPPPPGNADVNISAGDTGETAAAPGGDSKIVRKAGGVLMSSVVTRVEPTYPNLAKLAQVSGTVVVEVTMDEGGVVVAARAVSGHPLLQDAAVAAARQWKFEPTTVAGVPVKVVGTITFNFQL